MRYWYRVADGGLLDVAEPGASRRDARFALTPEVTDLPGPVDVCCFDAGGLSVDPARLLAHREALVRRVHQHATERAATRVTTEQGTFPCRRHDLHRYSLMGFSALEALRSGAAFSVTLRDVDGVAVALSAAQFIALLSGAAARAQTLWQTAEERRQQIETATPAQLRDTDYLDGMV
jgi:hypothetical protein